MSYVKIMIHLIWATKNREPLIDSNLKSSLIKHLKENSLKNGIYIDTLNCTKDHIHLLISMNPDQSISQIARLIKGESSHWVNQQNILKFKFEWQNDYFAASVSQSAVDTVREYIKNQEEHHKTRSFSEEYSGFIKKYGFLITNE